MTRLNHVAGGSPPAAVPEGQALLAGGLAQVFGIRAAQLYQ